MYSYKEYIKRLGEVVYISMFGALFNSQKSGKPFFLTVSKNMCIYKYFYSLAKSLQL